MKLEKRKHTRVDSPQLANLTFYNNPRKLFLGRDISLSGMFFSTSVNVTTGTKCLVELNNGPLKKQRNREIIGRVVRKSDSGFGVHFIRMDSETYMMLQTKLLYSCKDPMVLCEEF